MKPYNMKPYKRIGRETRGSQIAEAALVMPLMFTLLLGIYWFGRAYNIYATITSAAREGARAGSAATCATCGNDILTGTQVADIVSQTLRASKLDPSQAASAAPTLCQCGDLSCTGGPAVCAAGSPNYCVQFDVQLQSPVSGPQSCGVAVTFTYPYQFVFPFTSLNQQRVHIKAQAQIRGEY